MKRITPTRALYLTPPLGEDGKLTLQYQQFFDSLASSDAAQFGDLGSTQFASSGNRSGVIVGTTAARAGYPAGAFPEGTLYYETDRTTFYASIAGVWTWVAGEYSAVLASILNTTAFPADACGRA